MKEEITNARKSTTFLKVFFISLFILCSFTLIAQSGLTIYTDFGENNVSHGLYNKSAAMGHFKFGNNNLESGFQLDLNNSKNIVFSSYTINASRDFNIKGVPLELQWFCTLTDFSKILRETDWGALLKMHRNHFEMAIGTNFRTYSFSRKAVKDYEIDKRAATFHEVYNIMYSFSYNFKPADSRWNIGFVVTDIDYFIINHETNPILNLNGFYKLSSSVSLFTEASYKMAGATNMAVNYFGFFLKTGMTWNF